MSDKFDLTEAVYGTEGGVVGPRFLDESECKELALKCRKVLSLTGPNSIAGHHFFYVVEEVARDAWLATEEDMGIVNDIYEQCEREAVLRGERWEVES